jgi:hypothetical protein
MRDLPSYWRISKRKSSGTLAPQSWHQNGCQISLGWVGSSFTRVAIASQQVARLARTPMRAAREVRTLMNMQQEGEIAFQLHSLAQLQIVGGSVLLESRTYEV